MNRAAVALALAGALVACKRKQVPFQPPPEDDAAVAAVDAAAEVDAAVLVEPLGATKIVVGNHASCAIMVDATVRCWGKNSDGQLGNGTTADSPVPVQPNLRGVKDIVLGAAHACALLDDQSITCWGKINFGSREKLLAPTGVPGIAKAKRIFAVGAASCATLDNTSLVCWGDVDVKGRLRLSGGPVEHRVPTPTAGLSRVVALTANGALHEDGTVSFWGTDGVPVRTAIAGAIEVASTGDEVCALRRDGKVACAGPATRCAAAAPKPPAPKHAPAKKPAAKKAPAKKGKPVKPANKAPAKPAEPPKAALMPFEVLRLPAAKHLAFDAGLCVVTRAGKLQCLASGDGCKVDAPWPGLARVDYVTGSCAREADGDARCWFVDRKSRTVAEVEGVGGAISVAASSSHACAILGDRSIVCWGSNRHGALGRGKADEQAYPEASPVTL